MQIMRQSNPALGNLFIEVVWLCLLGISNLKEYIVYDLHKPARIHFRRRRIIKGVNNLLVADLLKMIPYTKYNKD